MSDFADLLLYDSQEIRVRLWLLRTLKSPILSIEWHNVLYDCELREGRGGSSLRSEPVSGASAMCAINVA